MLLIFCALIAAAVAARIALAYVRYERALGDVEYFNLGWVLAAILLLAMTAFVVFKKAA